VAEDTRRRSPRVSVCIPTIDRADLLREAIESVAAQTFTDFEIVVADNSGSHDLQRKIDQVLAEFPRLDLVVKRQPSRVGPAENFNSLIDAARGEFWVCLPDDDRLCPDFIARALAALEAHQECAFTFADHWIIRADGTRDETESANNTVRFGRHLLREGVYRHDQLFGIALRQSMCLQTAMFRRSVIQTFRFLPGIMLLDQSLFVRMGVADEPLCAYYIDGRVFEYRIHGAQITATTRRAEMIRDQIAVFETLRGIPRAYTRDVNAKLSRGYLALALTEAEEGSLPSARIDAAKSLRLALSLRGALGALLVMAVPAGVPLARRAYGWAARFLGS
jgi:glycosyltransferase involved in cell wall biosynthesis